MGNVIIKSATTADPITLIGEVSGICYGSNTSDPVKNYKRGLENIKSNHGRTLEFPQVYMVLNGYSARVEREFYTHIGDLPSRLQSSTRFINYDSFKYFTPPLIENNPEAKDEYDDCMANIMNSVKRLEELGIPKEDTANLLPLGMETEVVVRKNLRNLIDMSKQRLCSRAYHEYRELMKDVIKALAEYSDEWNVLVNEMNLFHPKCEDFGYCPETRGKCERYPRKKV